MGKKCRGRDVYVNDVCEGRYLSEEGAVELHDVGTVAAPHDHVQVHQQLLLLLLIHGGADPLQGMEVEHISIHHP